MSEMQMKTQYRFISTKPWDGKEMKSVWFDVPTGVHTTPVSIHETSVRIEFRTVPVRCQGQASFKVDGDVVQCEKGHHDEESPHLFQYDTCCDTVVLQWS